MYELAIQYTLNGKAEAAVPRERTPVCYLEYTQKQHLCDKPVLTGFKKGKGRAVFFKSVCDRCPLKDKYRSQENGKQNRQYTYAMPDLCSMMRRKKETTEEIRKDCGSKRCPIEGLNGRLKQFTPLRRLRVRNRKAVYHSICAVLTMHNIVQAPVMEKFRPKKLLREPFSIISTKKSFL